VAFALLHLNNPSVSAQSLVLVATAGVWLGMVRVATGSLWAAFAAHFGWNAAMTLLLHAPVSGLPFTAPDWKLVDTGPAWATGGAWGPEGGAFAAVGMLAATAALLARPGRRAILAHPFAGALLARPEGRGETMT
ncbi:MAG: CPBP family intramembrane metalloprotease, partial [Gemmatimonadetes bacterium]|nr:CPBP family intramembrane metalloprotease [Gemmatimonadota bacterium]